MKNLYNNLANLLYEYGCFGKINRAGFDLAQIPDGQSLADHTIRTALLAFILAELEGADPYKTAMMALVHDLGEIRIGDQHKVSARYIDMSKAEREAFFDQTANLPEKTKKIWRQLFNEKEERTSLEGIVAQDADWLENAITAREFLLKGHPSMQTWINNVKKALETESAKKLLAEVESTQLNWWQNLKKMTYKKLPKGKIKKLRSKY